MKKNTNLVMSKYRSAPAVVFISFAFKVHNNISVSSTFHYLHAFIQTFSCAVHSHMGLGCAVQLSDDEG